jgi:hypothetical protein
LRRDRGRLPPSAICGAKNGRHWRRSRGGPVGKDAENADVLREHVEQHRHVAVTVDDFAGRFAPSGGGATPLRCFGATRDETTAGDWRIFDKIVDRRRKTAMIDAGCCGGGRSRIVVSAASQ